MRWLAPSLIILLLFENRDEHLHLGFLVRQFFDIYTTIADRLSDSNTSTLAMGSGHGGYKRRLKQGS